MSTKPVLYSYFRSSASWRVRIALAYKGIAYEYKAVHLVKAHQKSDDYTSLNPMAQVPSLVIDGTTFTQSLPIIEYLEETRPGNKLLPKDPIHRAHSRRIAEIINSGIQPVQNLSVLNRLAELTKDDKNKAKWAHDTIKIGFEALERVLSSTAGIYCVGDEISIADAALVPQVYNAKRFKVDMAPFPLISRIDAECAKHEAFKAAHPNNQPDCPDDQKI